MKLIDEVFYSLDDKHQDLFTNSCFGHLLSLRNIKLASQLVHQLILRSISTSKENEVYIKVGDKLARFGLQEFTLVTGLNAGNLENEDLTLGQNFILIGETFQTEEARQDEVTEKVAWTKDDSNISNKDDSEKLSTSSHVCQPSNEIIVIEDPNSELAVRKGHRVKRRAAVLLSPYTNPLERRKLLNIQVYDPLREVDPAKVEDLNKWLVNASTSDTKSLAICEVQRKLFDELLKDDEWLIDV
ncbi:Hypothetical predicted protein [Olea europaea subsp. europaea]|uniref:Uncharacterized protein n=1 Tax=Olea europaea subsp. europaea TaxID=158383 RepID=A0A8S0UJE5_OLEEU|nr:Hypothetical predicted protein [Olea europaea subsp. europaea]